MMAVGCLLGGLLGSATADINLSFNVTLALMMFWPFQYGGIKKAGQRTSEGADGTDVAAYTRQLMVVSWHFDFAFHRLFGNIPAELHYYTAGVTATMTKAFLVWSARIRLRHISASRRTMCLQVWYGPISSSRQQTASLVNRLLWKNNKWC